MKDGHIFTEGLISQDYSQEIKRQLDLLSPDVTRIVHHISSPGGSVYGGYKGYHALKLAGKPIHTVIEGEAQSMATFMAYAGDTVEILNPSVFMIHNPSQGVEGDADALVNGAEELRMIEDEMAGVYQAEAKRRGVNYSLDEVKKMMKNETRMDAMKAKQMGFVDKVTNQLKAVARGKSMKKNKFVEMLDEIKQALTSDKPVQVPAAVDLKTNDGKTLHIESEDNNYVGKPATIDGQSADGVYTIDDGTVITCSAGIVMNVEPPMSEAQKALKAAQDQIKNLENQVAQEKAAAEAAKADAAKKTEEAVKAKEATAVMIDKMKQTVGDDEDPNEQKVAPMKTPVNVKYEGPQAKVADATKTFLIEHMPWLEQYYPQGFFAKYKQGGPNAVSILETNFNYTYPGILTTDLYYKPTLDSPALADIFTVDQGASDKKRYNLVNPLDKIVQPYTGCTTTANTDRSQIVNATIQMKEFQVYEGWCKDDFTSQLTGTYNVLAQEWLKTGNDSFDPAGTPVDKVIMTLVKDAMRRDIFRRVSFASGASSDTDYNQFDGLWKRLIDSSGTSNYCVYRAGSALGTGTLSSGNALTYLGQAWNGSNNLLKTRAIQGQAMIFVTQSIWDNYYDSLIGNGAVAEQQFANLQQGLQTLKYKGIPIIPVPLWDSFLAESDNPYTGTTRHLILFTVKENHILGVENGADLNKIESWYEMKDRKRYYRSDFKLGYQYLHCDLQTIMY